MEADFKIKGLDQLNRELKKLPEDFRTKSLNGAVGTATRLLRDIAIRNAPVDSGNLKTAIRAQKRKTPSKYISKYQVNVKPRGKITVLTRGRNKRSSSTYYARFLENGTKNMPARPFMRPAFIMGRTEAVATFGRILDKKISFYNRKLQRLRR